MPPGGFAAYGVATDGSNVFWVIPGAPAEYVMTCPAAGCPIGADGGISPTLLATGQQNPVGIAVLGGTAYWIDGTGAAVLDCETHGCNADPTPESGGRTGGAGRDVNARDGGSRRGGSASCRGPTRGRRRTRR